MKPLINSHSCIKKHIKINYGCLLNSSEISDADYLCQSGGASECDFVNFDLDEKVVFTLF